MQWEPCRISSNYRVLFLIIRPCDNVDAWAAFVIGILGGMMMVFANRVLFNLKIDDPVDAISIHFVLINIILGLRNAWS